MKTHIERLPEYYPLKDEDLAMVNWLTRVFLINGLSQGWGKEGLYQVAAKRMLVVDDEAKIREAYRRIFVSLGYDVMTASNAVDAQNLLVRNKFDIALLDINMAEVDGSILFELMRTFHKNIKVVVSSVYSIDEQKERVKEAEGYFDKSDGKDALVSLVSSLVKDSLSSD